MTTENISFYEFFKQFPNEKSARLHFEAKRWNDKKSCPRCSSENIVECKDHKPMAYRCKGCRKHFSVRTGTILEESKLPLHKWLMAMYMMTTARKGISSIQMAKQLGITQKSAWFLAQRIREAWTGNDAPLEGIVEVDETYFGGKAKNKHISKKPKTGRGTAGKQAVIGAKERDGRIVAKTIHATNRQTLQGFIAHTVKQNTHIITDDHAGYVGIDSHYKHDTVRHSIKEYVNGMAHTNGIESFWALLKRGYYGIYHHMSDKHLHRYVNEFAFRHNVTKQGTMGFIDSTITQSINKRLTYKELING